MIGGAIVRDATTGRRHNTALVFDACGALVASYQKVHLPDEDFCGGTFDNSPHRLLEPIDRQGVDRSD